VSEDVLDERLRSTGYTPSLRDAAALFARLADTRDDDEAKLVERALGRLGVAAAERALTLFDASTPPLRGRLCALVGRVARTGGDGALTAWLCARLEDPDPKTRRRAASALGKVGGEGVEAALIGALARAVELPELRSLVTAVGNVGGELALGRLGSVRTDDPELARVVREAKLKLERGQNRRRASTITLAATPDDPVEVLLHVRAGLEEFLLDELGVARSPKIVGRGRVAVVLAEPLGRLFAARTFLHVGFPLEPVTLENGDVTSAVVQAITSPLALRIFTRFTDGSVRYRLAWASGGRKRSQNFRVAEAVAAVRPELVNDPTAAPWEVVVTERDGKSGGRIYTELWPQGLVDPRFAYRRHALFASSHPTIAAALARASGVRADDVVWDPFAGSATELVERAYLGPYSRLYGTDAEPSALERARENLTAAKVERWELAEGDARTVRLPVAPSLVLTNPPYGKRVRTPGTVSALLDATLANVAAQLRPGGRVVWVSPEPAATARAAARHGFSLSVGRPVDVGGIRAELQVLVAGTRPRPR
jgi:precorrin-6B methylase 2